LFSIERLTQDDVRSIATYTRIGLSDEDLPQMTEHLNSIIATLKPIREYDLEGVAPTFHPVRGLENVMREDVVGESFTQEEALANAGSVEGGFFKIPSILGDSEG
jgi:aspartyl-tRNA(Asn)/glutamyl-tRNA(Gln) amidotransferase subunit C